jgi:hypothetical protein
MTRGLALASILLVSGCAHPQTVRSYEELRTRLHAGDRVNVTTSAGSVSGSVQQISPDALIVSSDSDRRAFSPPTIVRLERLERTRRRSTLKGLAIGGGTGTLMALLSDCKAGQTSCDGARVAAVAGGAGIGAAIGAAAGGRYHATLVYAAAAKTPPGK